MCSKVVHLIKLKVAISSKKKCNKFIDITQKFIQIGGATHAIGMKDLTTNICKEVV